MGKSIQNILVVLFIYIFSIGSLYADVGNVNFSFRLFKKILENKKGKEPIVVYPYHIGQIFDFLSEGALDNTQISIKSAIFDKGDHSSDLYLKKYAKFDSEQLIVYPSNRFIDKKSLPSQYGVSFQMVNNEYIYPLSKVSTIYELGRVINSPKGWRQAIVEEIKVQIHKDGQTLFIQEPCNTEKICTVFVTGDTTSRQSSVWNKYFQLKTQNTFPKKYLNKRFWQKNIFSSTKEAEMVHLILPQIHEENVTTQMENMLCSSGLSLAFASAANFRKIDPTGKFRLNRFEQKASFDLRARYDNSVHVENEWDLLMSFPNTIVPQSYLMMIQYDPKSQVILFMSYFPL